MGTIHSTPQKELVLQPFHNTSWEAPSEYQPWESFFECSVCKECLYEDEYIVIYNKNVIDVYKKWFIYALSYHYKMKVAYLSLCRTYYIIVDYEKEDMAVKTECEKKLEMMVKSIL